jgi:hypothetical protein
LYKEGGGVKVSGRIAARKDGTLECESLVVGETKFELAPTRASCNPLSLLNNVASPVSSVHISPEGDVKCKSVTVRKTLKTPAKPVVTGDEGMVAEFGGPCSTGDFVGTTGENAIGSLGPLLTSLPNDGLLFKGLTGIDVDESSFSEKNLSAPVMLVADDQKLTAVAPAPASSTSHTLSPSLDWVKTPQSAFYILDNAGVAGQVLRLQGQGRLGFVDPPTSVDPSYFLERVLPQGDEWVDYFIGMDAAGNFVKKNNKKVPDGGGDEALVLYDETSGDFTFAPLPAQGLLASENGSLVWTSGGCLTLSGGGFFDAGNRRVINVSPPTHAREAATVGDIAKCLEWKEGYVDAKNLVLTEVSDPTKDDDLLTETYARRYFSGLPETDDDSNVYTAGGKRILNLAPGSGLLLKERTDRETARVTQQVHFALKLGTVFTVCRPYSYVSASEYTVTHDCELYRILAYGPDECIISVSVQDEQIQCPKDQEVLTHAARMPIKAGAKISASTDRHASWLVVIAHLHYDVDEV